MAYHHGGYFDRGYNLSNIIEAALPHIINTLERESDHQFQWKLTRNLGNVSLFVKCKFRAKTVDGDTTFPVIWKPEQR